jgi:hypothetical protein
MSDSNKFVSSASLRQGETSDVVRRLQCLISSSSTAFAPNNSLNGVKFVALEIVVF